MMEAQLTRELPQEGTGFTGESLLEPTGSGSPAFSGGGKDVRVIKQTTSAMQMDSDSSRFNKDVWQNLQPDLCRHQVESFDFTSDDSSCEISMASRASKFYRNKHSKIFASSSPDKEQSVSKATNIRKVRGRFSIAGYNCRLAEVKAKLLALEEEELELKAQLQSSQAGSELHEGEKSTFALRDIVHTNLKVITRIATKSRHLKGTFVKALKDAVTVIEDSVERLHRSSVSEEMIKLQRENSRLQTEIKQLHTDLAALRAKMKESEHQDVLQTSVDMPASQCDKLLVDLENFQQAIFIAVGKLIDDRLKDIEDRLPPVKTAMAPSQFSQKTTSEIVLDESSKTSKAAAVTKSNKGKGKGKKSRPN